MRVAKRIRQVLVTLGLLSVTTATAATVLPAVSASATTYPVAYQYSSWLRPTVRPGFIAIGGDGGLQYRHISWKNGGWWMNSAKGYGTRFADNCIPNCALGTFIKTPATIKLSQVKLHNGRRYFSRMDVVYGHRHHMVTYHYSSGWGYPIP